MRSSASRRPLLQILLVALIAAPALGLTGCRRVLFPNREPRSQFETYDRVRGGVPPPYVVDEFGYQQPNLRERLLRNE